MYKSIQNHMYFFERGINTVINHLV